MRDIFFFNSSMDQFLFCFIIRLEIEAEIH